MPVTTKKVGKLFRVVEKNSGRLARRNGTPIDGGGHKVEAKAKSQARAVNMRK